MEVIKMKCIVNVTEILHTCKVNTRKNSFYCRSIFFFFSFKMIILLFFSYSIYGIWAPSSGKINIQKPSHLFICLIVQPNKQNNSHTHCRLRVQRLFRIEGFICTFFFFFLSNSVRYREHL